jgi:DNA-binding MarR family transcriptional regulator
MHGKKALSIVKQYSSCMKTLPIALGLILALAACSAAAEASLSYYGVESSVGDDLSVSNRATFKFSGPETHLNFDTSFRASGLNVSGNFGPVSCDTHDLSTGSRISCELSGITKDKDTLYLEFNSGNANYSYGRYHFNAGYITTLGSDNFFFMVKLPESATLAVYPANQSYVPDNGKVITDGRSIMVLWDGSNLVANQQLDFNVEYNLPPIRGSVTRYIFIGAGIVIVAVVAIAFFFVRRASRSNRGRAIASVLNPDEKRAMDIITAGEEKGALQKAIVRESGFSKAKVSRLVKSMSSRGLIKVEPVSGRENRILVSREEKAAEPKKEAAKEAEKEEPKEVAKDEGAGAQA